MFDDQGDGNIFGVTDALEALSELAENTSEAIIRQRASQRIQIQTRVTIRAGNSSQRHEFVIEGLTGDISNGGCQVLLNRPLLAGDVYWLTFSDEHVSIGALFARCMRCRVVRDDTFEAGFRFFHEVDLASALRQPGGHQW
ncbi:MAG: hypothetical protein A2W31_14590 [Planctomycetes bacterium RBG_16_64_10]|nr:MAG: hypothetical protein A2W31_14590 [Planctomycetes bacterium RBG_16_64_10]